MVDHRKLHVAHVHGHRVAEDQALEDRHAEDHQAHPRVAKDLDEFLAQQVLNPFPHERHSSGQALAKAQDREAGRDQREDQQEDRIRPQGLETDPAQVDALHERNKIACRDDER